MACWVGSKKIDEGGLFVGHEMKFSNNIIKVKIILLDTIIKENNTYGHGGTNLNQTKI